MKLKSVWLWISPDYVNAFGLLLGNTKTVSDKKNLHYIILKSIFGWNVVFIIVWVALRKFSMMVNWIWLLSGPGYANVMGLIVLYTERNSKQSTFNLSNILFLCWWNVLLKRLICFNDVYNQLIFNQTVEKIHYDPL